jgi:membrane fusion protein (multidrug efflux system)
MIAASDRLRRGTTGPVFARFSWAVLFAVVAAGCGSDSGEPGTTGSAGAANTGQARVVNVEVSPIEVGDFVDYMRITGEVEAYQEAVLSAEEGGQVESFAVNKGQWVAKGGAVARLDDDILSSLVNEARAAALLAEEQFQRQKRLWEEEGIGSEIAYLKAKYDNMIVQARLANLETRLAKTVIRAPFGGVFDENFLEIGEYAQPGAPVVRLVDAGRVKVTGGVPERFARSVHVGDRALVSFDIFPDDEMTGTISFVGRSVNEANRTFPIEILLENPGGEIKPRMVANVRVVREHFEGVVVVPQDAVLRTEEGHQAFVVTREEGNPIAQVRELELGPSSENRVVVKDGLAKGELLITVGQRLVDDRTPVRIVNADGPVADAKGQS